LINGELALEANIMNVIVRVPATSANLGPGFDTLGLALDLWNEAEFQPAEKFSLQIEGEGVERLPANQKNLIVRSLEKVYQISGKPVPVLSIHCRNRIPLGSGLGSSAAAVLTGLLAANALLASHLSEQEILDLAVEIEHHPDNAAAALYGGLVVSTLAAGRVLARKIPIETSAPPLCIIVVTPQFDFPTRKARALLPTHISRTDAVYNMSRAVLMTQALGRGDLVLLGKVMDDRLHQPYRLPLIPGARDAMQAAKLAGATAVALSGAGPSLIAFSENKDPQIGEAMKAAFDSAGLGARVFELGVSQHGAQVDVRL
jgi:homoserine kinase